VLLALITVVVGSISAILAGLIGRLTDDAAARCVSLVIAVYVVIVVPTSEAWLLVGDPRSVIAAGALHNGPRVEALCAVADLTVVALMVLAALPGAQARRGLPVLALGVPAMALSWFWPPLAAAVATVPGIWPVLRIASVLAMAGLAWRWRRGRGARWAAAGGGIVTLAQIAWAGAVPVGESVALVCSVIRLGGAVLMTAALGAVAWQEVHDLSVAHHRQRRELHRARVNLSRAAEQGHELLNGLAGLAAATRLTVEAPEEAAWLHPVVNAELQRLTTLLRTDDLTVPLLSSRSVGPLPSTGAGRPAEYDVAAVLRRQVTLHRASGARVELMMGTALSAHGSPDTLSQVVANLLANCARHAPDSAVRVCATRARERIRIRVSDHGPGLPARLLTRDRSGDLDRPLADLEPVRSHGLGLRICRRLLRAEQAELHLRNGRHGGAVVEIVLPAPLPRGRPRAVSQPAPDALPVTVLRDRPEPGRLTGTEVLRNA
jgi:two-component system OmpR family sensor kinase